MDIIEMARELGHAIQKDERYIKMLAASAATEKSPELSTKMSRFSELRNELKMCIRDRLFPVGSGMMWVKSY